MSNFPSVKAKEFIKVIEYLQLQTRAMSTTGYAYALNSNTIRE